MRAFLLKTASFALAMLLCLPALGEVKVVLTANKIVDSGGVEQKQPGDKAKPGDIIEYVANYKNTDTKAVKDVMATLPIPKGMEYIPDTANPTPVTASTDDVHYASVPLKREVKDASGKTIVQLVPYSDYRSLRWGLGEMAGGTSKSVKARMKVKAESK
jgi:uncharacterized repeat protein (TIGR01451 family)